MNPLPFPLRRAAAAAALPAVLFIASCGIQHAPENAASPGPAPSTAASATPPATSAVNPAYRVTIHYHRADNAYSGAGIWTWDAYQKHTPPSNELMPDGQDSYGLIFHFDRRLYGGSDKIGLLPRLSRDWTRKDGTDRTWTPAMGNEIWIFSGSPAVYAQRPDLTPHVEAAYADRTDLLTVQVSQPVDAYVLSASHIHVRNELGQELLVGQQLAFQPLQIIPGTGQATGVNVTMAVPLDFNAHSYSASIDRLGPAVPVVPRALLDDPRYFYEPEAVLGAIYSPAYTSFRIFAPTSRAVTLVLYNTATSADGRTPIPMRPVGKGIWQIDIRGDLAGRFYTILPEGPGLPGVEIVDPYATNTVSSTTRARITPPTPAPPPTRNPVEPEDRIICELHVRDFTIDPNSGVEARGLYLGWAQPGTRLVGDAAIKTGVDHLAELGVTDVQIMPVQDFANDETARAYNWGYVTSAFFSPEGMYASNPADDSRIHELKALITALHARGIGVIMDVVYNHTSDSAPFFSIAPGYYYRHLADGSFANGSGCGNEFRSEAPMVRKYILDSLEYWVRDYNVDGFRFDLMALLDRDTMNQVYAELRAIKPNIIIYGEPWTGGDTPLTAKTDKTALHDVPVGAFDDDFRNALHGQPEGNDPGFIQDGSKRDELMKAMLVPAWYSRPVQAINYMTCHDNLVLWDKLKLSMPGASDALLKRTVKLGYLVLLTSPGVPFMQGGEEFCRSKGGDDNSYVSPDSVNEIDWSLKAANLDVFRYVRDVIAVRKAHPLFRLRTREEVSHRLSFLKSASGLAYEINGTDVPDESWQRALVVVNPDNSNPLSFQLPGGDWETACDWNGGATAGGTLSGVISVPPKTGLLLYQE